MELNPARVEDGESSQGLEIETSFYYCRKINFFGLPEEVHKAVYFHPYYCGLSLVAGVDLVIIIRGKVRKDHLHLSTCLKHDQQMVS